MQRAPVSNCTAFLKYYNTRHRTLWQIYTIYPNLFTPTITKCIEVAVEIKWWRPLVSNTYAESFGKHRLCEKVWEHPEHCCSLQKTKTLPELVLIKNTEAKALCSAKRMWGKIIPMVSNLWAKNSRKTCLHTVEVMWSKWQPDCGYVTTCIHTYIHTTSA